MSVMPNDIYQTPRSNVSDPTPEVVTEPNLWLVVLLIFIGTIAVALLVAAIEYLIDSTLPGETFYSTFIPLFCVGFFFGYRRKVKLSPVFKIKALAVWFVLSLIVSAVVIYFVAIDVINTLVTMGAYAFFLVVGLAAMLALSYGALALGERAALNVVAKQTTK